MKPARALFCMILASSNATAGTSADYTLAPGAVDSGGLRGTSANYTVNGSAMAGNAGTSAQYTARTGFAGQLLEPLTGSPTAVAISITAVPLTVNEVSIRQLQAALLYDDHTTTPLAAGSVTWSVVSGPLTGISPTGLATAAAVYQDSPAVARGTYQAFTATLNLTVLDILPDNFRTYAGDGLPVAGTVNDGGTVRTILDPGGPGGRRFYYIQVQRQ